MSVDIKELKANVDIVAVLSRYGVDLKKDGNKWKGLCPFHDEKTGSFVVSPDKGKYKCFGCGESGDVLDFIVKRGGRTLPEAIQELADPNNINAVPHGGFEKTESRSKEKDAVVWRHVVPGERKEGMFEHYKHGTPTKVWEYLGTGGELIGCVCRFDLKEGKEVLPLIFSTDGVRKFWRWQGFDKPRPLYNLDKLTNQPTKAVLLVEGEKTCEAAGKLYPMTNCTTWIGGTAGAKYTNWKPLQGRTVIMWADNDKPGYEVMHVIYDLIKDIAGVVKWVVSPPGVEKGWDLADATWTSEEAKKYSSNNIIDYPGKEYKYGEKISTTVSWDVKSEVLGAVVDSSSDKKRNPDNSDGSDKNGLKGNYGPPTPPNEDDPNGYKVQGIEHFRILGAHKEGNGMVYYFYAYATKTVIGLTPGAMTKNNLMQLAPLYWWRNTFPENKFGFSVEEGVDYLIHISSQFGTFTDKLIRGRGAWLDNKRTVVHAGDKLFINGKETALSEYKSKYIYEVGEELGFTVTSPLEKKESYKLIELLKRLHWDRPINAYLLAGWCVVAPVCGALNWRPHIWLTGGAGTGKSFIFKEIVRPLLGETGLAVQGETSEAGLRQTLGHDALPVVFDEAEGEDRRAQDRMQSVLSLMRASSSNDGGVMAKGSAGGYAKTYKIRSCFAFASIGVQVALQSDRSRVTILGLMKNTHSDANKKWQEWMADFYKTVDDGYTTGIRSRTISLLPTILANIKHFSNAAATVIGEQRAGDQIGVLLAGAYSLVSDHVINFEDAVKWVKGMDWTEEQGINNTRDEVALMSAILEYVVRVETSRATMERTIGELMLNVMCKKVDEVILPDMADARLQRIGIKVKKERVPDTETDDWYIYISNSDKNLLKILEGTNWAKNHNKILERLPGTEKVDNMRFATGVKTRAVKIYNYVVFKGFEMEEGKQLTAFVPKKDEDLPF